MKVKKIMQSRFSVYESSANSNWSDGTTTLYEWISDYSAKYKPKVNYARSIVNDEEHYKRYKRKYLCACTMSGVFPCTRNQSDAFELNGIIAIDIDKYNGDLEMLKRTVMQFDYVFLSAKSASGKGIYVLCYYDLNCIGDNKVNDFKSIWNGIKTDFNAIGLNIDESCKDLTRLRIISHDSNTLIKNMDCDIRPFDKPIDMNKDIMQPLINEYDVEPKQSLCKQELIDLVRKIETLVKNGYGQNGFEYYDERYNDGNNEYDYARWRLDAWRLGSMTNADVGYRLFLFISKHAIGYTGIDDVNDMWNKYKGRCEYNNCVGYYHALYNRMSQQTH